MAVYKVTVATGDVVEAGTNNSISITLVGSQGESRQTTVSFLFRRGKEKNLSVHCSQDLGPIALIRLHKWRLFLEDAWFCKDVRVTAPSGTLYHFPCYQWLEGVTTVEVPEGSGRTHPIPNPPLIAGELTLPPSSFPGKQLVDDELQILKEHRRRELAARQEAYQWKNYAQGWPRCLNVGSILELDSNIKFSSVRATNFTGFLIFQGASHFLSGFQLRRTSWKSLDEMRTIFSRTQGRDIGRCFVCPHHSE
ncbi:LOXE3 isomerase, partial [Smithornis capensis]|nr:LOXE3 isomerase [Smithornis capensis]